MGSDIQGRSFPVDLCLKKISSLHRVRLDCKGRVGYPPKSVSKEGEYILTPKDLGRNAKNGEDS